MIEIAVNQKMNKVDDYDYLKRKREREMMEN